MFFQAAGLVLAGAIGINAQSTSTPIPAMPTGVPFPDTVYPGFASPNPITQQGSVANQTSPPKYPAPWTEGMGDWSAAVTKARALVAKMTLLEKVNLTTGVGWEGDRCVGVTGGVPRLGIRALCLQDSPLGVRFTDFNSAFPAGVNVAATWSRGLAFARGAAMGAEHAGKGVDIQLGPVAGPLGRAPEGGRNWEGFSPDPYLTGVQMGQSVAGIQSSHVIACSKHYIGNEQEHFRQSPQAPYTITDAYSANIDDVTMHELYLWPFADAVRAGTGAVMSAYNQVNNSYAGGNAYMLNYLLKGELGFQGFVLSDWAGTHSGVGSILAGLDMTMPGDINFDSGTSFFGPNLTVAVANGSIPTWRLDDQVTRILAAWYYVGRDTAQIDINFSSWTLDTFGDANFYASANYTLINEHVDVRHDHDLLIREIGAASIVLLKNVNNALPLTGHEKLTAVFGQDAGANAYGPNGCPDRNCDNGTLAMGWGSGTANFPYLVTPLDAISARLTANYNPIEFVTDNGAATQITALARRANTSIVFVNADSGEGYITIDFNQGDRNNLTLWGQGDALIANVSAQCNNTIVVVHSVGAVVLEAAQNNPNVTAILWAGLPGEQSGNSLADVLYGDINPGGKLPFTIAKRRQDYGTDLLYDPNFLVPQLDFTEGVFIDYRALDAHNITPTYEFGFGLSYTTFGYSNLKIQQHAVSPYTPFTGMTSAAPSANAMTSNMTSMYQQPANFSELYNYIYPYLNSTDLKIASGDPDYGVPGYIPSGAQDSSPQPVNPAGGAPGGNPLLYDVVFTVTATITNTGKVAGEEVPQVYLNLGGPYNPKVVLRGFERLSIQPGMSVTFSADLTRRDVSNWDVVSQNWAVNSYAKTVYVGNSSRNLPLSATLPSFK